MIGDESEALPTPESIAAFVKKNAPKMKKAGMLMMQHHGDPEVVREDDYQGHHVVIKTTYHIEVDGKPLMGHLFVTNEGQVQSHGLPNYTFNSAVQLVRELIDKFPEDFAGGSASDDMAGMPGMKSHATSQPAKAGKAGTGKKPAAAAKKSAARKSSEQQENCMAVIRPNILKDATALRKYCDGVNLLKNEFAGPTTTNFGIPGTAQKVSTYDLFVIWHHQTMMTFTPPGQTDRNAAHKGPVFLPWHRFMLRQLELNLSRILKDSTFGLPYWDWAADGSLPNSQQIKSKLWTDAGIGGTGFPVINGPFAFNASDPKSFRVRVESGSSANLRQVNRGLRRQLAHDASSLPKKTQTAKVLTVTPYDAPPWTASSSTGFRNQVEGWTPNAPALHNLVHVWIGGDMSPASSPNDPAFFLNHCNIDRIWEAWMQKYGRVYVPDQTAPNSLKGHRINDPLGSLVSAPTTPAAVLDVTAQYTYDSLDV